MDIQGASFEIMRIDKYTSAIEAIELAINEVKDETVKGYLQDALRLMIHIRNEERILNHIKDWVKK